MEARGSLRWSHGSLPRSKNLGEKAFHQDLQQAGPMSSQSRNLSKNGDVRVGLQGLEEAQTLRNRGDYKKALRLYELSLEVLIRALKNKSANIGGFDRSAIETKVQTSLSDAEVVKEQIKRRGDATQQPAESTKESKSSSFESICTSLSLAIERMTSPPYKKSKPQAIMRRPTSDESPKRRYPGPETEADPFRKIVVSDLLIDTADLEHTTWDDIVGLDDVKQALQENAILPLLRPDLFTGLRKQQNILLWGPPGTGKTMLVRAVARESECSLFVCSAGVLTSKWMGEAEKLVRALFKTARELSPSIIFIDEMDSLLSARKSDGEHEASRRFKTEFMTQMEGITKTGSDKEHVLVLACTNCPWDIDHAVLRRFPRRIMVPLPDEKARLGLLQHLLKKAGRHRLTKTQIEGIVRMTEGFSCSDITSIASEASFGPLRSLGDLRAIRTVKAKDIRPITFEDFNTAIHQTTKSVTNEQLKRYKEWLKEQSVS